MKKLQRTRSEKIAIAIARRYSVADEIALNRKADIDQDKIDYLAYVQQCKDRFSKGD